MSIFAYHGIVLRYDEIALKGANRKVFEKRLERNIMAVMRRTDIPIRYRTVHGRMWFTKVDQTPFTPLEWEAIKRVLVRVCGLSSFSPVLFALPQWETLKPLMIELTTRYLKTHLEQSSSPLTFRLRVRRAEKRFAPESRTCEMQIVESLDHSVLDFSRLKVDLKNAQHTLGLEIRTEQALIWFETVRGIGGLPVGSNDTVLTLLSGGIDSSVAAWRIFKRGCKSDFITFDSFPYTPRESVEKVRRLMNVLALYQGGSRLFVCNIVALQKAIRDCCDSRLRTVLYRRAMMRIACKVAEKESINALVTGESVGQVASQTIVNLNTIDHAADRAILRPLCGMDKIETIELAEKIGTFSLSKEQVPDSCTVFAPAEPATRVKLYRAEAEEKHIENYNQLIDDVVAQITTYYAEY